jgi:hypothetical protein
LGQLFFKLRCGFIPVFRQTEMGRTLGASVEQLAFEIRDTRRVRASLSARAIKYLVLPCTTRPRGSTVLCWSAPQVNKANYFSNDYIWSVFCKQVTGTGRTHANSLLGLAITL